MKSNELKGSRGLRRSRTKCRKGTEGNDNEQNGKKRPTPGQVELFMVPWRWVLLDGIVS